LLAEFRKQGVEGDWGAIDAKAAVEIQKKATELGLKPKHYAAGSAANVMYQIPDDDVVNSVGAGDAFAGGYLRALDAGLSEKEAINVGHKLGEAVIQQEDPRLDNPLDLLSDEGREKLKSRGRSR
jgi:pyridoxal/pyridoxine/pyridoxamine kinase